MAGKSANTQSADGKRKPPRSAWKKGQSGNPKGSPKRGESWAEIVTRIGNMTGAEVAEYALPLAKQLRSIGEDVTLKEAAVLRVFVSIMNEPTPGLLNALMDRAEGSPRQTVEIDDARLNDELAAALAEVVAARDTARNRDTAGNGRAVGDADAPAVEAAT